MRERGDIQRLLRENITVLGDDLLAVPYPPDGPVDYSQDKEYRVTATTAVIEAAIDEP
jgi:hypothetical protein